jgi:LmbE family N-acetylglucosaminyl deacetylase
MIVAHPDDEVLWGGGLLLSKPSWRWWIASVTRGDDRDRARRFRCVQRELSIGGRIASLDDGPDQDPLDPEELDDTIRQLLPRSRWDLVATHGPCGEYTSHLRHEEVCRSVVRLWESGWLRLNRLWMFAYEDGQGSRLPEASDDAHRFHVLDESVWAKKYRLMTQVYGFSKDSWEARATPRTEAYHCFTNVADARAHIDAAEKVASEHCHVLTNS